MKTTKKLLAMLLALTMILSLAVAVSADEATYTIAIDGKATYRVYKMFDVTVNGETKVYKVTDDWKDFFNVSGVSTYLTLLENGLVYGVNGHAEEADGAAIAQLAAKYVADKNIATTITASPNAFATVGAGYYLLVSTDSKITAVKTVVENITVKEKTEGLPYVKKNVQENSTEEWGETNDADIGETINFKIEIHTNEGASNYILHDAMDAQLTFNASSVVVKKGETELNKGTDYKITSNNTDSCTFEIKFEDSVLSDVTDNSLITVTYTATLNEDAEPYTAYTNKTWLTHTSQNIETAPASTTSKTYNVSVHKIDGTTNKDLSGAKFVLTKTVTDGENATVKYYKYDTTAQNPAVEWVDSKDGATAIVSDADGKLTFTGVDAGSYTLVETAAPTGYVTPADGFKVTVTTESAENNTFTITNATSSTLPETGGMGTTIFYVLGGILMLAAVVVLVSKKRMTAE